MQFLVHDHQTIHIKMIPSNRREIWYHQVREFWREAWDDLYCMGSDGSGPEPMRGDRFWVSGPSESVLIMWSAREQCEFVWSRGAGFNGFGYNYWSPIRGFDPLNVVPPNDAVNHAFELTIKNEHELTYCIVVAWLIAADRCLEQNEPIAAAECRWYAGRVLFHHDILV